MKTIKQLELIYKINLNKKTPIGKKTYNDLYKFFLFDNLKKINNIPPVPLPDY